MIEASQLLPLSEPPFDFDKEELLDISVELFADRLKDTVAWLVESIREQQQLLESHEVRLDNISTARSVEGDEKSRPSSRTKSDEPGDDKSRPTSHVGDKSPQGRLQTPTYTSDSGFDSLKSPLGRSRKSITQGLGDSLKDEMLSMKVTKLQLELNALPTRSDLAGYREEIGAEMKSLAENLNGSVLKEENAVRSELATLTEDMYARLQRICDDVMKRLEDVESLTARTDETTVELKARINRIHVNLESQGIHVNLESQVDGDANKNVTKQQPNSGDNTVAGTNTTVRRTSPPNESDDNIGTLNSDIPPGSGNSIRKSQSERRLGTGETDRARTPKTPGSGNGRSNSVGRDDTNSVAFGEFDDPDAVVTDPSIFAQISNLASLVERNHQMCRKVEGKTAELEGTTTGLGEENNKQAEKLNAFAADMDAIKKALNSLGDFNLDTMRKDGLGNDGLGDAKSEDGNQTPGQTAMKESSTDGVVPGRGRPSSIESATGSLGKMMSEMDDLHMLIDGVPAQIEEMQKAIAKMNGLPSQVEDILQAIARLKSLEDSVSEFREILFPMDEPELGTVVSTFAKRVDDIETWKTATDKRMRRMNPTESEFASVQNELERLRKLFEFIQQVLPPDAAEAMNFFSKSFSPPASRNPTKSGKNTKDIGSKSMAKGTGNLVDHVATSMGPEVAFEMQRAKLEEEVRQHEKAMREEFANLTTAIKSLQREMQHTSGKTVDLVERVARCEGGVAPSLAEQGQPQGEEAGQRSSSRGSKLESSHESLKLAQHEASGGDESDLVSKGAMQQALKETREDFRNWLDEWSSSFVSALQKKADSNQVGALLRELQQAIGSADVNSDTFALIAKRALLGRCASCDANLNVDIDNLKRNPPVPKPSAYPNRPPAGAPVTMRPPGVSQMPQVLLPKILDSHKNFPKGKVFKTTPSAPDLRQVRMQDHSEENIQ